MSARDPLNVLGQRVEQYILKEFVDRGSTGYVYKAERDDIDYALACKLIPLNRLRPNWEKEIEKAVKLRQISRIIEYHSHGEVQFSGRRYAYILSEFVDGDDLASLEKKNPDSITLSFVLDLLRQTLEVFRALEVTRFDHGDINPRNIMIARPDPRKLKSEPSFKIGDFGIGGSLNGIEPRDDYFQLAHISAHLLERYVDTSQLGGEERFLYDRLVQDFLPKRLLEKDPTVGDYVRSPRELNQILDNYKVEFRNLRARQEKLKYPFDYLNCEQFGDSFELLQKLYSDSFPGYDNLLERTNTLLTGPRGCGKTTIFRNLSLKARLAAKTVDLRQLQHYAGVYYHCVDLFLAFPYMHEKNPDDNTRKAVIHYFNLCLLYELLDILHIAQQTPEGVLSRTSLLEIQRFLSEKIPSFTAATAEADVIRNAMSIVEKERQRVKVWTETGRSLPELLLPLDFLWNVCRVLQQQVPWMARLPVYFFLDDYSKPKVSEGIQKTLNDIIFQRTSEFFFKVATESTTSFHARDSRGKLLERTREYDLIDLGAYFMDAEQGDLMKFLGEVINNRLKNAETVPPEHSAIQVILGDPEYTYLDLALGIREGQHVQYKGWSIICDLCSGDVANILHVVRDVLTEAGYNFADKTLTPIRGDVQDKVIRVNSINFLNSIQSVPRTGSSLRRIAEAFGHVSNTYLKERDSKNEGRLPPFQAFRLELLENPRLDEEPEGAQTLYDDLIKYAVFVLDVRGKSQRGDVVPRLFLRRLLLPAFLLTPNLRDSIRIEPKEFVLLLTNPAEFETRLKNKPPRGSSRTRPPLTKDQARLDN